jgi:hypothetical protein
MAKLFWQSLKATPIIIAASLLAANGAIAQTATTEVNKSSSVDETLETINNYQEDNSSSSMSQVTNVNQLRDVSPTDWAYEALRSLVDRYGCIAGFPNQTYRGSQPLSRYEFAAGLNSCLNQIERLIASSESVVREDLDTINRLTQEFEAELATLGGRIDNIESRTAFLEDNQFSTTTKLEGEAIFAIADTFGGGTEAGGEDEDLESEPTFSNRVRLNFDSSFYGEDRLRIRLQSGNTADFGDVTGTNSARLGFDNNTENSVEIDDLYYRFPLTERVQAYVGANGLNIDDIFNTSNPQLASSGTGALTRFNRYNPLVIRGTEGAGVGANIDVIEDRLSVNALYLTDDGADPSEREGLTSGSFSAGGQVVFSPIENLELAATYVRDFKTSTENEDGEVDPIDFSESTVSGEAINPFGEFDTAADKVGLGASYNLGERFVISGFGGYAKVKQTEAGLGQDEDDLPDGEIWTWGATFSVLDLLKEGSALSIAGGQVPKFTTDIAGLAEDVDTSYLIEAQYKFPINDNILITPGAYVILNPNHDSGNDEIWAGVLRTTFEF